MWMRLFIPSSPSAPATSPGRWYTRHDPTADAASRSAVAGILLGASPGALRPAQTKARQNILYTSAEINRSYAVRYSSTPCPRVQTAIIARLEKVIEPDACRGWDDKAPEIPEDLK